VSQAALSHDLILGRYRPVRPLGSGGMGHVWLARDEESGLDVALKIVAREGKAAARAEREAAAAAALRHPRCQRIYALARDPGHVYIAYEYVPGRTMREAVRAGQLNDRSAIEAAAQVCEALAHAHGRGIVHRDVKPSNILLAEGEGVDVRLLDFGLAQMAEFDTLTAHGDVPGTLAYVSPERLRGEEATAAADVWAVGVMLWEALAGRHPFWEDGPSGTSRRIKQGAPPLEELRPDLPSALCEIVGSTLTLSPARRPPASRLAHELRSLPERRKRKKRGDGTTSAPPRNLSWPALSRERALPGALAGVSTGWVAATLPFYPAGWPWGLAAAAAGLGFLAPRAGLAFALATVFFPLANISLGLAVVYAVLAVAWLALSWRDARAGLIVAAGPLLAPLGTLAFLPLAAQAARGTARRAAQAGAAVLLAAVVAGLRGVELPFHAGAPPLGLGIAGSSHPGAVLYAIWSELAAHPVLLAEAAVAATAAALLPHARRRGPWPAALFGGALLAAVALAAPGAPLLPLIAGAWATAAVLAFESAN
jgi:eukaryotic-like serine/threonine-protein kinase